MGEGTRRQERMADIHCHILPGLDDGPGDMGETLRMLRLAWGQGIACMIATPHHKAGRRSAGPQAIQKRLEEVRAAAGEAGIPIRLYAGNELLYDGGLAGRLEEGLALTMNGTGYVLVEFLPGEGYAYIRNALDGLLGMGYRPILAHAERCACLLGDPGYAGELHGLGVELQVNAGSVTGRGGRVCRRFVHGLLEKGLADYVATDAHDSRKRTPDIQKCRKLLCRGYGEAYAGRLLYGNARERLLKGEGDAGE